MHGAAVSSRTGTRMHASSVSLCCAVISVFEACRVPFSRAPKSPGVRPHLAQERLALTSTSMGQPTQMRSAAAAAESFSMLFSACCMCTVLGRRREQAMGLDGLFFLTELQQGEQQHRRMDDGCGQ